MSNNALIVVDVQNDFLPGGALAVPKGNEIIPVIHEIIPAFRAVVFTMDSHPKNHKSFASQNPGKKPFEMGEINGRPQMMWPDHCIISSKGWLLAPSLRSHAVQAGAVVDVVMKGTSPDFDSYSGFKDDGGAETTLLQILNKWEVRRIFVCGLATDYCVKATALDGRAAGFSVSVVADACRGLDKTEEAYAEMVEKGVILCHSKGVVGPIR
jgi:nicotinamidase/pyrazinamidase